MRGLYCSEQKAERVQKAELGINAENVGIGTKNEKAEGMYDEQAERGLYDETAVLRSLDWRVFLEQG